MSVIMGKVYDIPFTIVHQKKKIMIMIDQIPQERQLTVTGYIRLFVSLTIPSPIMHMCILYYGNHCPCTQCCNENNHLIHYKKHNISVLIPNLVHKCFSNNIA
eukprot:397638_1